ncbi:Flp family type IVb pilin [Burkholderia sp. Ac-20353]|uniref:Flp family type IVb pilin n=1 Tax=Burkholderia sp. Ac-20353 TaxID=2703894 RepID=UPI00197C065F|nr:Flp family type IVb pilin [Burkholderia sp. Ac-20353]MBN3791651.1 Flp family type IVb pilin [Burkholderia sp. Ac-20353]
MQFFAEAVAKWIDDERGVTSIEYALMGSLVAIAILAGVGTLGHSLNGVYQRVAATALAAMQ